VFTCCSGSRRRRGRRVVVVVVVVVTYAYCRIFCSRKWALHFFFGTPGLDFTKE
jgi:hypothetical protein